MIAVVSVVWVASGQLTGGEQQFTENGAASTVTPDAPLISVRVRHLTGEPLERKI